MGLEIGYMSDLYFTEDGNIALSPSGDIAVTDTPWRDDLQQAYIRCMTDIGDYLLYPRLGASLSELRGMAQSPETAEFGKQLISSSLDREERFAHKPYRIDAFPTGPQSIRFDLYITAGNGREVQMSIEQSLESE